MAPGNTMMHLSPTTGHSDYHRAACPHSCSLHRAMKGKGKAQCHSQSEEVLHQAKSTPGVNSSQSRNFHRNRFLFSITLIYSHFRLFLLLRCDFFFKSLSFFLLMRAKASELFLVLKERFDAFCLFHFSPGALIHKQQRIL